MVSLDGKVLKGARAFDEHGVVSRSPRLRPYQLSESRTRGKIMLVSQPAVKAYRLICARA